MATSWFWDESEREVPKVLIIQRSREYGRVREDRILLTAQQIERLAKDTPEKDEGRL